jgi:hypothetical protein
VRFSCRAIALVLVPLRARLLSVRLSSFVHPRRVRFPAIVILPATIKHRVRGAVFHMQYSRTTNTTQPTGCTDWLQAAPPANESREPGGRPLRALCALCCQQDSRVRHLATASTLVSDVPTAHRSKLEVVVVNKQLMWLIRRDYLPMTVHALPLSAPRIMLLPPPAMAAPHVAVLLSLIRRIVSAGAMPSAGERPAEALCGGGRHAGQKLRRLQQRHGRHARGLVCPRRLSLRGHTTYKGFQDQLTDILATWKFI